MKKSDFTSRSIAAGLHFGEFDHLTLSDRKKLLRVMWRISERSYRRGFQHGGLGTEKVDVERFRYVPSLDNSPWPDSDNGDWKSGTDASDRLFMECGELRHLGFKEPEAKK